MSNENELPESGSHEIVRPTKADHARRLELVRKLLLARCAKWEIKKVLYAQFGIKARTAERYLSRARDQLLKELDRPKKDHVSDAYEFYVGIIRSKTATAREKILAQDRIDKLLGLEAPTRSKHEHSGPDGGPISIDQINAEIQREERLRGRKLPP